MKFIKKVAAIIKDTSGNILLFKEKLIDKSDWKYQIPKGTFELNIDKNLNFCIKREIYEETNISENNIVIANVIDLVPKYYETHISVLVLFLVELKSYDNVFLSNKNLKNDELIKDYKWISYEDFKKIKVDDFIDERIYNIIYNYFMSLGKK
ncbi:hypothetical protein CSB08_00140 [Candidatus Gracilibacteria bacterium]|nr:MAG: hypothetical protein CSB08_00140 [Candidatus Gracilibacteria bacterium]PIE85683.1 MAG: hypothetical protein CSA08_00600 [Candidatus Gracilibacteria bacterium]